MSFDARKLFTSTQGVPTILTIGHETFSGTVGSTTIVWDMATGRCVECDKRGASLCLFDLTNIEADVPPRGVALCDSPNDEAMRAMLIAKGWTPPPEIIQREFIAALVPTGVPSSGDPLGQEPGVVYCTKAQWAARPAGIVVLAAKSVVLREGEFSEGLGA